MILRDLVRSSCLLFCLAPLAFVGCGGEETDSCEEGTEGCACYPNKTCNDDLQCLSKLCVDPDGKDDDKDDDKKGKDAGAKADASKSDDSDESDESDDSDRSADSDESDDADESSDSDDTEANPDDADVAPNDSNDTSDDVDPSVSPGAPPKDSPVALHGQLSVVGTNLVDVHGAAVQLKGVSSMWLNWEDDGYAEDLAGLIYMRDNWNLSLIRVAMGIEANDNSPTYLKDPAHAKAQVEKIVNNAIKAGVYVIIDWHDHEAIAHQTEAQAFFSEMATKFGDTPNVLYEVFNEPDHGSEDDPSVQWETWSDLKPYHEALRDTIRDVDPDNVIILGTPSWDQDVDVAAASPVSGSNLMYAFHFYACSHTTAYYLGKADAALNAGLPLFVSEWGAATADGNTTNSTCINEAGAWHDWMDQHGISWAAWKLDNCPDATCFFVDDAVPTSGGWTTSQLNGLHPQFAIERMQRKPATVSPVSPVNPVNPVNPTGCTPSGTCADGDAMDCDEDGEPIARDCAACALLSCGDECCASVGYFAGYLTPVTYDFILAPELIYSYSASATSVNLEMAFDFDLASWSEQSGSITFEFTTFRNSLDAADVIVCATTDQPDMFSFTFESGDNGCSILPYEISSDCWVPQYLDVCWGTWTNIGSWNKLNVRTRATLESTDANTYINVTSISVP